MDITRGTRQTLVPDAQGSIVGTLDSGGTLTKTGYQSYGENPSLASGSYQYTARRFDPEAAGSMYEPSGLYYYRARMYSPTLGCFLQPDPIGYAGGNNLYAYVGNDLLNRTDPAGLWFGIDDLVVSGVGLVAGGAGAAIADVFTGHTQNFRADVLGGAIGGTLTAETGLYTVPLGAAIGGPIGAVGGAARAGGVKMGASGAIGATEGATGAQALGNLAEGLSAGPSK